MSATRDAVFFFHSAFSSFYFYFSIRSELTFAIEKSPGTFIYTQCLYIHIYLYVYIHTPPTDKVSAAAFVKNHGQ